MLKDKKTSRSLCFVTQLTALKKTFLKAVSEFLKHLIYMSNSYNPSLISHVLVSIKAT